MQEPFPRLDGPPTEKQRALWGVLAMVLCIGVVLIALVVLYTIMVEPFRASYGQDAPETLAASGVMNLVWNATMIATVFWFVRRGGGTSRDLGLALPVGKPSWPRVVGLAAATFVAMYLIVVVYGVIIETFNLDFLEPDKQVPDEYYDSDAALAVLGIAVVFGAPLAEEVLFRGFLFGGTRPLTGVLAAALITGFVFSLAHYNPGLILPFTLVGAVLALSYHRWGTLFVPIGAHFLFNLVSFSVLVFVPEARPGADETARIFLRLLG